MLKLKLHKTLTFGLILCCSERELTNYDVTKSSSDNCPKFLRTVPFVKRRKKAVFKVEYLGDFLTKPGKTLYYDYLDWYVLFQLIIKLDPISLHLTFNQSDHVLIRPQVARSSQTFTSKTL